MKLPYTTKKSIVQSCGLSIARGLSMARALIVYCFVCDCRDQELAKVVLNKADVELIVSASI